jgi:lysozyme family protein
MSNFSEAIQLTLAHEGGYTDNPTLTNMGITQTDMPGVDIKTITVAQAVAFYQANFWNPLYGQIKTQNTANKLFDLGVLFGKGTAVKLFQKVLKRKFSLVMDGAFGPITLKATNIFGPIHLLKEYKDVMTARAIQIGQVNPQDQQFVQGWINRVDMRKYNYLLALNLGDSREQRSVKTLIERVNS